MIPTPSVRGARGRARTSKRTAPALSEIANDSRFAIGMMFDRRDARSFGHRANRGAGGGHVALTGVVHDHAVGVEPPAQSLDSPLHAEHPATGHVMLVA